MKKFSNSVGMMGVDLDMSYLRYQRTQGVQKVFERDFQDKKLYLNWNDTTK